MAVTNTGRAVVTGSGNILIGGTALKGVKGQLTITRSEDRRYIPDEAGDDCAVITTNQGVMVEAEISVMDDGNDISDAAAELALTAEGSIITFTLWPNANVGGALNGNFKCESCQITWTNDGQVYSMSISAKKNNANDLTTALIA